MKKLLFAIPLVVPFYSHSAETVESCLAKSHTENSFTNVWKDDKTLDRYANYEGCLWNATGVVVCTGDETQCYGTWVPIGLAIPENEGGGSEGGGSEGGGSEGGGSGGGSGSGDFDYEKMANANKGAMTENADENALQSDAKGKLSVATDYGAAIDGFIGDVSGLANGNGATGDFAGSNSQMAQVGDGDNSPLMNNFRQYLPSLPQSVECRPFVFGAGKPYEFSIDCDKINIFRGVFAFLLYVATFMYVFSTFANILRNKES